MNIGSLFLNIGIKGAEKTVGALETVLIGLDDAAHMSLETKAAIVGLIYGFEQLASQAVHSATSVHNLDLLMGENTETIRRYEYVARVAGTSAEEMDASFKGVQDTISNFIVDRKLPAHLLGLSQAMLIAGKEGLDASRLIGSGGTEYLFQWLQKAMQVQTISAAIKRKFMEGVGVGPNVMANMMENTFNPEALARAQVLSDRETNRVIKARQEMEKTQLAVEKATAKFISAHGADLARGINQLIGPTLHLAGSLDTLATKLDLFKKIGNMFGALGNDIDLMSDTADIGRTKAGTPEREAAIKKLKTRGGAFLHSLFSTQADIVTPEDGVAFLHSLLSKPADIATPSSGSRLLESLRQENSIVINQSFPGGADLHEKAKKGAHEGTKKALNETYQRTQNQTATTTQ